MTRRGQRDVALGIQRLGRIDVALHIVLGWVARQLLLDSFLRVRLARRLAAIVAALHEGRMRVDQVLQRQAGVDELLHLVMPVPLNMTANPRAVVGHAVHHLAVGFAEPDIVLEEIAVAVDVSDDRLLIDRAVVQQ